VTTTPRTAKPRKTVELDEYSGAARRFLRSLGKRAASADPEDLAYLVALQVELADATRTAVDGLRSQGRSWADIAQGLGMTRQGCIKAYATDANRGTRGARPLAQR
jgi:hypothetical protein